jgi:hypothetical protein
MSFALRLPVISRSGLALAMLIGLASAALSGTPEHPLKHLSREERTEAIRRAQVWMQTDVASLDLKSGPSEADAFSPEETVACDFVKRESSGKTPKFFCEVSRGDEVKVKYGEANGEVYAEVAATRLLWALGFGADRMYPVKVTCGGCSADPFRQSKPQPGEKVFDPASIERRAAGHDMETSANSGWNWIELDGVDETKGGAPHAQRDALKLLAVLIQHTDSKPSQQRLICLDEHAPEDRRCERPFMMLNDVGVTFGKANLLNSNTPGSVNLKAWSGISVWKGKTGCVGNLPKSWSGSLEYPRISEEGRAFLAGLLQQLSDRQLHDLFEVARVTRRQPDTTVEDWVNAFKTKRDEIVTRVCES